MKWRKYYSQHYIRRNTSFGRTTLIIIRYEALKFEPKMTLDILARAVNMYRTEGTELMLKLGEKFEYYISILKQFDELIWRRNPKAPRKGKLSNKIKYVFQGNACHFHKMKTQQNIEVILTNPPKFGALDAWFLKAYLSSTDEFKEVTEEIDCQDLKLMIKELYTSNKIEEIKEN